MLQGPNFMALNAETIPQQQRTTMGAINNTVAPIGNLLMNCLGILVGEGWVNNHLGPRFCAKNDGFCACNERFCISNDEFCISNDEFSLGIGKLPFRSTDGDRTIWYVVMCWKVLMIPFLLMQVCDFLSIFD